MKSVLVVDDEVHIRNVLALKLKQAGYDVLMAKNGAEGLEIAQAQRPSIIVTDCQMPRMTGLELIKHLAADPATSNIPIIMLTSREFEIGPAETAGTAVQRVVGKPFSPKSIIAAIAQILPTRAGATQE